MENIQIIEKRKLSRKLNECILQVGKQTEYVFLCIGIDKITGDCFGPIVGSKLKRKLSGKNIVNVNVYGDLENNITLKNIEQYKIKIENMHKKACIIVIDAALSKKENIGEIYISKKATMLGKGLHKNQVQIGDISIKAVVGKDYKIPKYNFQILQNVSLNFVMQLADNLVEEIMEYIQYN